MNTPAGTSFDKQLNAQQHDPNRQFLFELYSGHGNSEQYRDWRAVVVDENGARYCPEPSDGYLPCCWRAGEIIRERCDAAGLEAQECAAREREARQNFVDAGNFGHLTIPGQQVTDWLDCGTCPDCFNEPMDHRPMATGQYALALSNFDTPESPLRFRFGFIGSSDNHRSQPGTGYKETQRKFMTEAFGSDREGFSASFVGDKREPEPYSIPFDAAGVGLQNLRNMERQNSFWLRGGLVAAHSQGRSREAIWDSLQRREVYATSGDRILLCFDMRSGGERIPMGSDTASSEIPRFRVGNTMMITTDEGNVIFDNGLVLQVEPQLRALKKVSDAPVRYIVLSHSHADHIGGTRFWQEQGTEIVTHEDFVEEQRYLSELEPYQYQRNRTLFPWMPAWEDRPDIAMMRYGGIEPTITVGDWETHSFTLGGVEFQVIGTPGAEGADNAVLWLPGQKILFSGDFFGPQFPQFPNVFTMRGEKIRKPMEYVKSLHILEVLLEGDPTNTAALRMRRTALETLLVAAENGLRNDYEIYWLQYRLQDTNERLGEGAPGG